MGPSQQHNTFELQGQDTQLTYILSHGGGKQEFEEFQFFLKRGSRIVKKWLTQYPSREVSQNKGWDDTVCKDNRDETGM